MSPNPENRRDAAERQVAGIYLTGPQRELLWELQARERGETPEPSARIARHLPSVGERLVAIEKLADLELLTFESTRAELTPWGRFVASVAAGEQA